MTKAQEQAAQAIQEPQAQPAGHSGKGARIVVVGGGVAGLEVATALGKSRASKR